ncbi:hypothetical protein M8J77_003661 [Diaphorina citri]|nr:hypothetical protein M8J77_003661 [Diaphorina citri]
MRVEENEEKKKMRKKEEEKEAGRERKSDTLLWFSDDDSLHADPTGTSSSQGLSIAEFVEAVRSKGRSGLCLEYEGFKIKPPDGSFEVAKRRENLFKNRYSDVLAYDHTRVLLSQQDDVPGSDYINANFVDGYKQKNAFISTQGK